MSLLSLTTRSFRGLQDGELELPTGLVAILGVNGAGKTTLLEAMAVLGNVSSFRTSALTSLARYGSPSFDLSGIVCEGAARTSIRQEVRVGPPAIRRYYRGARRLSAGEYLTLAPVSAFSTQDKLLIAGAPEERRRFIDRLVFHTHPQALSSMHAYRRALRQRSSLLLTSTHGAELDAFEHSLANEGAAIITLRLEALRRLTAKLAEELAELGWSLARPVLRYHYGDGLTDDGSVALAQRLRVALARTRRSDQQSGRTVVGPHRHDILLTIGGVGARDALSTGQAKLLATALKLAAIRVFRDHSNREVTVVFDDIDAELDAGVLGRLVARLAAVDQALVSSAHPEVVGPLLGNATVWHVAGGAVSAVSARGVAS